MFVYLILTAIAAVFLLAIWRLHTELEVLRKRADFVETYRRRLRRLLEQEAPERKLIAYLGGQAERFAGELPGAMKATDAIRSFNTEEPDRELSQQLVDASAERLAELNEQINQQQQFFIKPVSLLALGFRTLFAAPIRAFGYAGLMDDERILQIESSGFMSAIGKFASVGSLIASGAGIVSRWVDYFALINMLTGL